MTKATATTPREALLNATLIGFHAGIDSARKVAATTSGKGYMRDRLLANSLPDLGMDAAPAAEQNPGI